MGQGEVPGVGEGGAPRIELVGLSWLFTLDEGAHDLCAHGDVVVRAGEQVVLTSEGVAVSAASLYLLRTLTTSRPIVAGEEPTFPCCGHAMVAVPGSDDVVLVGCEGGGVLGVERGDDTVRLTNVEGRSWSVPSSAWVETVFAFVDAVAAFYAASAPKRPCEDDVEGFDAFRREWARRRWGAGRRAPHGVWP